MTQRSGKSPRRRSAPGSAARRSGPRESARKVAYDVLRRIDEQQAYANLVLGPALDRSTLSEADKRFVTELVYGTTRMQRACDAQVERFSSQPPDDATRTILRLGVYQLMFAGVATHAAVGETVELAPHRTRGFVNAVLRRVSTATPQYASLAAELSYPDWIVDTYLSNSLGSDNEIDHDDGLESLRRMNEAPPVTMRDDGYFQDLSSQWVSQAVGAQPGERIFDVCAAPGGKATGLAEMGAEVFASDVRPNRAALVVDNARQLDLVERCHVAVADATRLPYPSACADAVLIDAPCSGLGALRRRADARWRIEPSDVADLARLQARILTAAATLVRPGGRLIYSVCTITAAESVDHVTPHGFEVDPTPPPVGDWRPFRQGWRVLPHDADTDGMVLIRYRRRHD